MMFFQVVVFLLVVVGVFVWNRYQHKFMGNYRKAQGYDELNAMLFEQTGYRHKVLRGQPLEQQVAYSEQLAQQQMKTGQLDLELVRELEGYEQTFVQLQRHSGGGVVLSARWTLAVQQSPNVVFHIAERDMTSKKRELRTGFEREFSPVYQSELRVYDPELAGRFRVWGNDEQSVNHILSQQDIRATLLSLKEVDLCVFSNEVSFSDPTQENFRAGMGGGSGMIGANPKQMVTAQSQLHQTVSGLLLRVARSLGV